MPTTRHTPTIGDAEKLTSDLVRAFPAIDAVLLCGSVARGDANPWSDLDLLIASSDPQLTAADLRQAIPDAETTSIIFCRTPAFAASRQRDPFFTAHLKKEGVVLFDRVGVLRSMLAMPTLTKASIAEEVRRYRAKLAPYRHPERYNNNFLFCLSRLYAIGKGVIMLTLAATGIFEFNRERAFERFAATNPDLAQSVAAIARLRPFYRLVNDRKPEELPFSYLDAAREMAEAVRAIESIAERALCL